MTLSVFETGTHYFLKSKDKVLMVSRSIPLEVSYVSKPKGHFWIHAKAIMGFVKMTKNSYMVLVTEIEPVALIGQHTIYHVKDTKMVHLGKESDYEELRYIQLFQGVNLSKHFYFSYSYTLSQSLQNNIRMATDYAYFPPVTDTRQERFVWNSHLLSPVNGMADSFFIKVIYGFIDTAKVDVFGCSVSVVLIGRRSKEFAGTRFLKRGISDQGHVANEVETEQIVYECNKCLPIDPMPILTSFVSHRGSVPLFWTQENLLQPKPGIEMVKMDPYYRASESHFKDLKARYGHNTIVWNLVKAHERKPRESLLSAEFEQLIRFLNQQNQNDIRYTHFDISKAKKTDADVVGILEGMSSKSIKTHGFFVFKNGSIQQLQDGVTRVSCIDCLDRTNAAQFFLGKSALGHQLQTMNLVRCPTLLFDTTMINMLIEIYHDLGDTIALQYGGSQLVNTVDTYRRTLDWQSHSRDILQGIKRYYSNSFTDLDKQNSINLFLGLFKPSNESEPIWQMTNDRHLHFRPQAPRLRPPKWHSKPVVLVDNSINSFTTTTSQVNLFPCKTCSRIVS